MIADLQNQAATAQFSATLGTESKPGDFQTERYDWQLFRTLETLGQMAGVIDHPEVTPEGAREWLDSHPSGQWRGYVEEAVEAIVAADSDQSS